MIELSKNGVYLVNGTQVVDENNLDELKALTGSVPVKEDAAKNTIAYGIL